MRNQQSSTRPRPLVAGSGIVSTDRRNRRRLRELCDEVLASFRAAKDAPMFTEQDRAEGRALVGRIGGK